jgi:hypothetical protein
MDTKKRNFLILGVFAFLVLVAAVCGVIYWNRKSLFDNPSDKSKTSDENRTPDANGTPDENIIPDENKTPDKRRNITPNGNKVPQKDNADFAEFIKKILPKVEAFEAADLPESEWSALLNQLDENLAKAKKEDIEANPDFFEKMLVAKSNMLERAVINTALKSGGNVSAIHNFAREHCSVYHFRFLGIKDFSIFPRIAEIPRAPFSKEYVCKFNTLKFLFTLTNFINAKGKIDYLPCVNALNDLRSLRKRGEKFHDYGYLFSFPIGAEKFITDERYSLAEFENYLKKTTGIESFTFL